MIRLCPLPYSISNGAISTFPSVSPWSFIFATAIATPKLFIHIFIGSRLAELAELGEKMDGKTKAINYASILGGIIIGVATGWIIYKRLNPPSASVSSSSHIPTSSISSDPAYYSNLAEFSFPLMRSTSASSSDSEEQMAENSMSMSKMNFRPSGLVAHRHTGSQADVVLSIPSSRIHSRNPSSVSSPYVEPWCEEKGYPSPN